ncbi:putative RNA-directed DNA polymerase [Tanacetum coccineum]
MRGAWWLFGGFNKVREPSDRLNSKFNIKDADIFNDFIRNNKLVEIPLGGRKYTHVSDDGIKFSKLDRFFVATEFNDDWGNLPLSLITGSSRKWLESKKAWIAKENEKASILRQKACVRKRRPRFVNNRVSKIMMEDAASLEVLFSEKEVWDAVCECGSDKAPGSDGFNFKYIKRFWGVIKADVLTALADPLGLWDFKPISLIGSLYKIIVKLLAERVKKVIGKVIDEVQNAMGFGSRWRKWVASYLNSSSISILVNGSPTDEFIIERGVRQGDPLSPFLFILAAEGLNALLKEAVDLYIIKGIRAGAGEVVVSHLQYVDDTIIFGEWSRENACNLINVLKCFEEVAGLKINFKKSKVYGVGVEAVEVDRMARFMCCGVGEFPFMYLGLPIGVNMRRVLAWNIIIDIFKSRLSDWKAKSMSFGGRLTLVKSVLGSLSLYYFLMFRVPLSVSNTLESVRKNFFWGGLREGNKWHWLNGIGLSPLLEMGGLILWIRPLQGRSEGEFKELEDLVKHVSNNQDKKYMWKWRLDAKGVFSMKGLSKILVRVELDKKGIDLDFLLCPLCDNVVESVDHCLVLCEKALTVWDRILGWNSKVFKGKLESSSRNFQDIQLKTFEWVSRRSNKGKIDWDQWTTRPQCYTLVPTGKMYHMYNEQLFCDYVVVGDKTKLLTEFQNNDSPSNIQEELGAANIEGNGDSDEFNLGQTSIQRAPKGKKETFNYYHSSLRNVIE